jgi:DNA invertase Pin-like site-specific DNA recombinase
MNIGYIRVSTKEQSTARQLEGVDLDEVYEDKISGVIKERPNLTLCLHVLRAGDTLHVHSIDRLARSLRHLQEIVEGLTARKVRVHFHAENLIFESDSSSPMAMLMLHMLGAIAQFERSISKVRQSEGTSIAKASGTRSGKPWGKQPLDMTRRAEAIELSKAGNNISQIAKAMKLSRGSIYKLLS